MIFVCFYLSYQRLNCNKTKIIYRLFIKIGLALLTPIELNFYLTHNTPLMLVSDTRTPVKYLQMHHLRRVHYSVVSCQRIDEMTKMILISKRSALVQAFVQRPRDGLKSLGCVLRMKWFPNCSCLKTQRSSFSPAHSAEINRLIKLTDRR